MSHGLIDYCGAVLAHFLVSENWIPLTPGNLTLDDTLRGSCLWV